MKIYLDNCCYNRPFDDLSQAKVNQEAIAKLFVQSLIKDGVVQLCYSYMTIAEVLDCPIEYNKANILAFISETQAEYVGYDKSAVVPLANVAIQTGIKDKDANHVACAIIGQCEYFITTDKRLLKYETDKIELINPVDFVMKWEEISNA